MNPELALDRLFHPRRVLLVGATDQVLFSAGIARYLIEHGFADRLTMVNPHGKTIFGQQTVTSIAAAGAAQSFDLAVVVIPAPAVPDAIDELGKIGCPLAIVESAGFAESGPAGAALQEDLLRRARKNKIRILGPNCVGVVETHTRFATTEVQPESLTPGGVALIAQSGVFGNIVLDWAPFHGLRNSKVITMGNRVDLDEADFLHYLADDPDTRVAAMYLEGVADGRRFMAAVGACSAKKPVIVLKGGRTSAGARAVGSHTASLAGADAVFDGALAQAGGYRAHSLEHLTDVARAFDLCPAPAGPRVGMLTSSGSQAILATDVIDAAGMQLPELAPETVARLRALAPAWVTIGNPLDLGPSGLYPEGIQALLDDPNLDALLIHIAIPWGAMKQMLESGAPVAGLFGDLDLLRAAARRKPVLVSHIGHPRFVELIEQAIGSSVPIFPTAERAAAALVTMSRKVTGDQ